MSRRTRPTLLTLVAVLAAGAAGWWFVWHCKGEPLPALPATAAGDDPIDAAVATDSDAAPPDATDATEPQDRQTIGTDEAEPARLRIRLCGLHPDASWTEPVLVVLARDRDHEVLLDDRPDPGGRCSWRLPAWAIAAEPLSLDVSSRDPAYQWLVYCDEGRLDLTQEIVLDVQAQAVLHGRVLDTEWAPVPEVRVAAFAIRNGKVADGKVGEVSTDDAGTYRMHVPAAPLLLVAAPMRPLRSRGIHIWVADRNGYGTDCGDLRCDLLPASQPAQGRLGQPTQAPDFVLAAALPTSGSVHWSDGTPVALATVQVVPRDAAVLRIEPQSFVQLLPNGTLLPGGSADTDDDGSFRLPGVSGLALDVTVARLQEATLVGEGPRQQFVPPNRTEFVLPRPVRLRVEHDRAPVPNATITIDGGPTLTTDALGSHELVCMQTIRVRASRERRCSSWLELEPAAAGTTVTLPLDHEVGEALLEFDGPLAEHNTIVRWRCTDGREGRQQLQRGDGDEPFRMFLAPGRYHVVANAGPGELNGTYLLPASGDLEVTAGRPARLVLLARFGGQLLVHATDADGLPASGTCRIREADGIDVSDRFSTSDRFGSARREGSVGELLLDGANWHMRILPPATYTVTLDLGAHGRHERTVVVRERAITRSGCACDASSERNREAAWAATRREPAHIAWKLRAGWSRLSRTSRSSPMRHLPIAFSLLVTSITVHAQSVTASVSALTPITVAGSVGGQTFTASVPAGPLVPGGSILVTPSPIPAANHLAFVSWATNEQPSEASATLGHWLQAFTGPSLLQAGPHEFLISITATAPTPGILQLQSLGTSSPFASAPLMSIDVWNDGQIDYPTFGGGSASIDLPGFVFDSQPTLVRIVASASLQGAGESFNQLTVRALPAADMSTWTSAIGCATTSGITSQRVFADRGIDFRTGSLLPQPTVLVIGLSQQAVLLPPNQGVTCLLLPALDIVLWEPTGYYHVPLPPALRPVVFYAQGVEVAPGAFLPTDAIGVNAF